MKCAAFYMYTWLRKHLNRFWPVASPLTPPRVLTTLSPSRLGRKYSIPISISHPPTHDWVTTGDADPVDPVTDG